MSTSKKATVGTHSIEPRTGAIARAARRPVPPPAYQPQRQTAMQAKPIAAASVSARQNAPVSPPAFRAPRGLPAAPGAARTVQCSSFDIFDRLDELDRAERLSDKAPSADVSFKIIHKHKGGLKVSGDTTDRKLSLHDFAKQGRQIVNCTYMGPQGPGRTHYEIICQIRGLYGMTKYIKFHFTSAGYFAIYNAQPGGEGLQALSTSAPMRNMDTSEKLYAEFLRLSSRNGPYKAGVYTCQNFAQEFYYKVTGQKVDGYDPDGDFM